MMKVGTVQDQAQDPKKYKIQLKHPLSPADTSTFLQRLLIFVTLENKYKNCFLIPYYTKITQYID